ncbi:MAG: hypothetical protein JWL75_607 [Parcubacteria group bacterium]|nr:hypothetical protein [Parcubacteria group bacterium]
MRFFTPALSVLALILIISIPFGAQAAGSQKTLGISIIRAVRLSDTTVTLSYRTSEPAVGILRYTTTDGGDVTLTDSAPEVDHLFTIQSLDPKHGYSFILKAETVNDVLSNTFTVLLSPETIGAVGASILPGYQTTDANGAVISNTPTASTTPVESGFIAVWAYLGIILLLAIVYGGYRVLHRQTDSTSHEVV